MDLTSTNIASIAKALSAAQAEIENATKNAENPHFKSGYADLSAIWDACRAPLTKNGLSVTQTVHREGANIVLHTTLMHISGECIRGEMPLLMTRNDMQGLGSALTYARRYSLAAMVGIAQEDDDGNASTKHPPQKQYATTRYTTNKQITHNGVAGDFVIDFTKGFNGKKISDLSPENLSKLHDWCVENKTKSDFVKNAAAYMEEMRAKEFEALPGFPEDMTGGNEELPNFN